MLARNWFCSCNIGPIPCINSLGHSLSSITLGFSEVMCPKSVFLLRNKEARSLESIRGPKGGSDSEDFQPWKSCRESRSGEQDLPGPLCVTLSQCCFCGWFERQTIPFLHGVRELGLSCISCGSRGQVLNGISLVPTIRQCPLARQYRKCTNVPEIRGLSQDPSFFFLFNIFIGV